MINLVSFPDEDEFNDLCFDFGLELDEVVSEHFHNDMCICCKITLLWVHGAHRLEKYLNFNSSAWKFVEVLKKVISHGLTLIMNWLHNYSDLWKKETPDWSLVN